MSSIEDPRPPDVKARELELLRLLQRVWTYPFTTKSDRARDWADEIGEAASRGFLTLAVVPGSYVHGRVWKITLAGLSHFYAQAHRIADEEVAHYVNEYTQDQEGQ